MEIMSCLLFVLIVGLIFAIKIYNTKKSGKNGFGKRRNSYHSDNTYGDLKGRFAENRTAEALEKLAMDSGAHVMNNVRLPLYEKTCEIDHLVIGRFGVLVVETKGMSGIISGNGKQLVQNIGPHTYTLYNPQYQNKTHIDNVSYHLRKGNFRNVPVIGVVVFAADDVDFPEGLGIRLSQLPYFYNCLPNSYCNTEKIYSYIKKICVSCSSMI